MLIAYTIFLGYLGLLPVNPLVAYGLFKVNFSQYLLGLEVLKSKLGLHFLYSKCNVCDSPKVYILLSEDDQ